MKVSYAKDNKTYKAGEPDTISLDSNEILDLSFEETEEDRP